MEKKIALVLSGGSIKGAFQAGAIKAFIEKGYQFSYIYGISVGSLNDAFISNEAGKQNKSSNKSSIEELKWGIIGDNLVKFWKEKIRKPEDVVNKRKGLELFVRFVFSNFKGVVDTKPIHELVKQTIDVSTLLMSPIKLTVGAVNLYNGDIKYAIPSDTHFIDYLLASTAIPIIMPVVNIGDEKKSPYLDGGIRDVAPLKQAIDAGADEIVCITCQPISLGESEINSRSLFSVAERVMDIVVNETVNNDLEWANFINTYTPKDGTVQEDGAFAGKRNIPIVVIRPSKPIGIDLSDFSSTHIEDAISKGYNAAIEALK